MVKKQVTYVCEYLLLFLLSLPLLLLIFTIWMVKPRSNGEKTDLIPSKNISTLTDQCERHRNK